MTKTAAHKSDSSAAASPELRAAIAQFCRRRSIEAASAISLIALTSFSQAWALSVSELNVESSLGQPLRATLDIATSPGELVNARCLRVNAGNENGMPGVGGITLSVSTRLNGATVRFNGTRPLREPMTEMILNVDCSGTPALTKSFLVMLDPPSLVADVAPTAPIRATEAVRPRSSARPTASARQRAVQRTAAARGPIAPGGEYVVQPGDILSVIASRVAGRPDYSVWPIAQRIYDINPNAFDSREPDSLRVGATLNIPALTGSLAIAGNVNQVREVLRRGPRPDRTPQTQQPARAQRSARPTNSVANVQPEPSRVARRTPLAAAIVPRTPVVKRMAYTEGLSRLSLDRLRQRRAGQPFIVNLTTNAAPPAPTPQPVPQPVPDTAVAVPAKISEPTVIRQAAPAPIIESQRGISGWLLGGIALLLGALLGTLVTGLGLRRWLAAQKAEQEAEIARAKRHQARLDESRQQRTDQSAPSIVVHEELPRVDLGGLPNVDVIGSVEEVAAAGPSSAAIGALLQQDAATEPVDELSADTTADDVNVGESADEPDLSVDAIDPEAELDYDVFQSPGEADLAMLERDYAASVTDVAELEPDVDFSETQALLSPEKLGMVDNATEIIASPLDLELPEGHEDDTELSVAALKKDADKARAEEAASDLEQELTEAVIKLDTDLLDLAQSLPRDNDPTAEAQLLPIDEDDADQDLTSSIPTRDSEDFYHLEASSIRKVDALAFEEDLDDDDTQLVSMGK